MKEFVSAFGSRGQITVPVAVRRHLGVDQGDKLSFVIGDDGRVELKIARLPDVISRGETAGTLEHPLEWAQVQEIAREDRFEAKHKEE
jgi:bifunctional DNA-binding transcriptional regulator/antitoxin component of YhaV-PrlF toxin-antitoxin module